jgi:DNA-directed RNA polymerase subunit E"
MAGDRLVCRDCHSVIDDDDPEICPTCGSSSLTDDWDGYVIILHPEDSKIAHEMEATEPGKYALKVR